MRNTIYLLLLFAVVICACNKGESDAKAANEEAQKEAQAFIDEYTAEYMKLAYEASDAQWLSLTRMVEGDTTNEHKAQVANEAFADFTGSKENIERTRELLENKDQLTPIQVKQLDAILYEAAGNPGTVADVVKALIKASTEQEKALYSFKYTIGGKEVDPNELVTGLVEEQNPEKRRELWLASKEVGKGLKGGLEKLRDLRNKSVQALGYDNYFAYQVSDYGMSVEEMRTLNSQLISEIWPLYRELHTYARYELAKKYGVKEVPEMIPADWLPNRWGQDWNAMVKVEGIDLDASLKDKDANWIVEQGEDFYKSLGLGALPQSFYDKSDMFPVPEGAEYKKNNHASAWHMDLENDVRCLMSITPTADWYETVHHELGHIYYYMLYATEDVPPLLRGGANRAYHEAFGSMLGLAAMQKPFLEARGLIEKGVETDEMNLLLKEALNYIVFIPWSSGVMTEFEHALYAEPLSVGEFNKRWWDLKAKYQGIVPPVERSEEYCDAATKTHINDDAAQYYDYALSYVQLFQFHNHIATKILKQDPRATNYYGSKEVGDFLKQVMSPGATRDWRELTRESIGEDLSANAMLNYFAPLTDYIKKLNEGRTHTLPEKL